MRAHDAYRMIVRPLAFVLRNQIDDVLDIAIYRGVGIRQIKVSMHEFSRLLHDPDFVDNYTDGYYRDIPLRLVSRDVWT